MTATLSQWIESSEDWLMWRILTYAKSYGHTKYTSTLEEAWRVSIQGLSQSVIQTLEFATEKLELGPDQNFAEDPVCASAIEEAACHRERGIDLKMFLGLFKYYRQTYIDRLTGGDYDEPDEQQAIHLVNLIFDRLEIAFCTTWIELAEETRIHELQDTNRILSNEMNRLLTVTESLASPVFQIDPKGRLSYANTAAAPLLGRSSDPGSFYYRRDQAEVPVPRWLSALTSKAEAADSPLHTEYHVPGHDDRTYEVRVHSMLDVSDKFLGWVVILHDITDLRLAELALQDKADELERLSLSDPLTGLLNRRGLFALGEKHVALARRRKQSFGVLYGDVDSLKLINDHFGHAVGDAVLVALSAAMQSCFRSSDTLARISGDEFVVLLPDRADRGNDEIGDRLNEHLESALGKIQESPSMSSRTGWAHFDPEHHSCFEELLAEADADMYSSKREKGKAKTRS
ncbi:MAG: GGDEF domain-containing protein [bacterium]|nr:GGDEF domain-containing protein [bacterium]